MLEVGLMKRDLREDRLLPCLSHEAGEGAEIRRRVVPEPRDFGDLMGDSRA